MHKNKGPVYYSDYLNLPKLLDCQNPLSRKYQSTEQPESHDEMLFIVVHQAFELWFKQILHELNSIIDDFSAPYLPDQKLGTINQRLKRIIEIQSLLVPQLSILETMTPMDFLEFRDLLIPASGFQSVQFREIEIKMGLNTRERFNVDREFFTGRLTEKDKAHIETAESTHSLFNLMEKWLERLPLTNSSGFNFWEQYRTAVDRMLNQDEETLTKNLASLGEREKQIQVLNLENTKKTFASLFDQQAHQELVNEKKRRLSQPALLNALFILLYRHEPYLTQPFEILNNLMVIDENFTHWRYKHALLAQRMLGTKIGTGGSSGHTYLKNAADNNKIYLDLFNLSTYIIARSYLPTLPENVKAALNFKKI